MTELRKRREQLETQIQSDAKQADLAEQKLRQLAAERSQQSSPSPVNNTNGVQGSGKNVDNKGLRDKYKAAIQQAVSGQWSRPLRSSRSEVHDSHYPVTWWACT